jgi:hypothetical protein
LSPKRCSRSGHPRSRTSSISIGELRSAERSGDSTIELSYENSSRAFALLDRKPARLEIDGAVAGLMVLPADKRLALLLPRGQHLVTIHTE